MTHPKSVQRGSVTRCSHITRRMVQSNPDKVFVFGDNMACSGFGGQARDMRGEPNAIGIPTKWTAARGETAYFSDGTINNLLVMQTIDAAFKTLEKHLRAGRDVVIPDAGVGGGLAELDTRAPKLHKYIRCRIKQLSR